MTSTVSAQAFQQQQQNLQQLHNLEQNFNQSYGQSKSFTSTSDTRMIADVLNSNYDGNAVRQDSLNSTNTAHQQQPQQQQQQQYQQYPQQQPQQQQQRQPFQPNASRNVSSADTVSYQNSSSALYNTAEFKNPLVVSIPINSNPTDILAGRFSAWRSVITSLVQYLNEIVSIQDEIVRQQVRLSHAVNFPVFAQNSKKQTPSSSSAGESNEIYQQNFFLSQGAGSIHDIPNILINYHSSSANLASQASKELNTMVIPRLEDLRRELLVKIKEIKSLDSDFKTRIAKELSQTKIEMSQYQRSVEEAKYSSQNVMAKNDPYLTKIVLDKQIRRQITEENYLHEAYINLQTSGKELEKVVVIEIQNALTTYAKLAGEQAQNVFDKLISSLDYGFLTKQPSVEWDQFIAKDKNFIDENLPKREPKQIHYQNDNDPLTYEVRSSFLERRSKFLKSYSRGYYVLTPTFFHEFKSADRRKDLTPVLSLPIDEIELEDHSRRETNQCKFVLKKVGKLSSHKYIFRSESYESMLAWYNDIKNLKGLSSPTSRGAYALKNNSSSRQNAANHSNYDISRVSSNRSRTQNNNSPAGAGAGAGAAVGSASIDDSFDEHVLNNSTHTILPNSNNFTPSQMQNNTAVNRLSSAPGQYNINNINSNQQQQQYQQQQQQQQDSYHIQQIQQQLAPQAQQGPIQSQTYQPSSAQYLDVKPSGRLSMDSNRSSAVNYKDSQVMGQLDAHLNNVDISSNNSHNQQATAQMNGRV